MTLENNVRDPQPTRRPRRHPDKLEMAIVVMFPANWLRLEAPTRRAIAIFLLLAKEKAKGNINEEPRPKAKKTHESPPRLLLKKYSNQLISVKKKDREPCSPQVVF